MGPTIDHVAVPSRDPEGAAGVLGRLLGSGPVSAEGPDGDMWSLGLDGCCVLFAEAGTVAPHHLAFRVDEAEFAGVVARVRAEGLAYGNDPEDPTNGESSDPLGGVGRIYFVTADGHLFEVTAGS